MAKAGCHKHGVFLPWCADCMETLPNPAAESSSTTWTDERDWS